MSTAVTKERAHPDKYKKDFDAVIVFLTKYINKRAPTLSAKVASVGQTHLLSGRRPLLEVAPSKERLS